MRNKVTIRIAGDESVGIQPDTVEITWGLNVNDAGFDRPALREYLEEVFSALYDDVGVTVVFEGEAIDDDGPDFDPPDINENEDYDAVDEPRPDRDAYGFESYIPDALDDLE